MVFLSVVQVSPPLGECLSQSIANDMLYVGKFLLNVLDIPLIGVQDDTGSRSELVVWSWVADCNRKPHQTV